MADAIHRKHHHIGAADETREESAAVIDAAIVVKKTGAELLAERAQMAQLIGARAEKT